MGHGGGGAAFAGARRLAAAHQLSLFQLLTMLSRPRFFLVMLAAAFGLLALTCALPHDRYLRYQSLTDAAVVKAGWIYERIHFDPTPMDVAFIGTSHSVFGIDSMAVERACIAAGGAHCRAGNFALQHLGRDAHWLLAREVIQERKPRLLVIEVQEYEPRAMHPAFGYLADASDVLNAPLVINTSYFSDLARLPLRQLTLFAHTEAPSLFGAHSRFEPALYRGSDWNDTYAEFGSREHPLVPHPRSAVHTAAQLEYESAHPQGAESAAPKLPPALRPLEYRATLIYLQKIIDLARRNGIAVRFLYMPSFNYQAPPAFADFYAGAAPMWQMPQAVNAQPGLWLDVGHLNTAGAAAFSQWLGEKIAMPDGQNIEGATVLGMSQ